MCQKRLPDKNCINGLEPFITFVQNVQNSETEDDTTLATPSPKEVGQACYIFVLSDIYLEVFRKGIRLLERD